MELPNRILVGYGVINEASSFLEKLGFSGRILIVSGQTATANLREKLAESLESEGFKVVTSVVSSPSIEEVQKVASSALQEEVSVIASLGGGKAVDVAKLSAYNTDLPFVNFPTSASNDGLASPFASIKGSARPYSYPAKPPVGILADVDIIAEAPKKLLASGCGDLVAKITAVSDWNLARDEKGEYHGSYAASLARLSSEIILSQSRTIGEGGKEGVRIVVEALISAGVAAGIAGSSRPCSGSEHLFSHALDMIAPSVGLHGEKCGLGTIMMMKLHGLEWEKVREALINVHAPTNAHELGLTSEQVVAALIKAPSIRPDRFTILHKVKLDKTAALELARSTLVV